jgi:hypothetical protein
VTRNGQQIVKHTVESLILSGRASGAPA